MEPVCLMGVLNVTPDSFFDGGKYGDLGKALRQVEKMVKEGADILDIGGESSRPGAKEVPLQDELDRVIPVLKAVVKRFPEIPVSVDTRKSEVACRSLQEGAKIINDISALRAEAGMAGVIKEFKPTVAVMHMRGDPQTMQRRPFYGNVVQEVKRFLSERSRFLIRECGLPRKKIWVDPGIGFGKTPAHNLQLIKNLKSFLTLGFPVMLGCSRKSFLSAIRTGQGGERIHSTGKDGPEDRLEGSLACACWATLQGVSILRVHDVGSTVKALNVLSAIQAA